MTASSVYNCFDQCIVITSTILEVTFVLLVLKYSASRGYLFLGVILGIDIYKNIPDRKNWVNLAGVRQMQIELATWF